MSCSEPHLAFSWVRPLLDEKPSSLLPAAHNTSHAKGGRALTTLQFDWLSEFIETHTRSYLDHYHTQVHGVEFFLRMNPQLVRLVEEAQTKLREYFGRNTPLKLELIVDKDDHEQWQTLFVVAVVHQSFEEAAPILDRFDDDWWLDASVEAKGKFQVTVEYCRQ